MFPKQFESRLSRLIARPVTPPPSRSDALSELANQLDAIERHHRLRAFLRTVKSLASHLVLEGDEDDVR